MKQRFSRKLPYKEGSVFCFPLRDSGYGRGVVARSGKRGGCILGYFFGPILQSPEDATLEGLSADHSVLCCLFGDLGLMDGTWQVIGAIPDWDRSHWPNPDFMTRSNGWYYLVRYSDDNPIHETLRKPVKDDDPTLEDAALYGSGAVEIAVSRRLRKADPTSPPQS